MNAPALAVDLGGTKLLAGLVAPDGRVVARERIATPQGGPLAVARAIRGLAETLRRATGFSGVGVAVAGPTDHAQGLIYTPPNLEGWGRETPFGALLASELGERVAVDNDANAAALGEAWIGAGRGIRDLVYVTVSTGIGGGLVLDGRLHRGRNGTAGEIGHVIVDPEGPPCRCGNRGCLEALASGPAIAGQARAAVSRGAPTSLRRYGGDPEAITAATVAAAAHEGDALATDLYRQAGTRIGIVLGNLLAVVNPARIIVGGGVSRAGDLLFRPIREAIAARAYPWPALAVEVVPAVLGDDVGLVGAAALVYAERS